MQVSAKTPSPTTGGVPPAPAGAPIPKVDIEAVQGETNYKYKVLTNDGGQYTLANLREGTYRLTAKANGFQDLVTDNVLLAPRDLRPIAVLMKIGAVQARNGTSPAASHIETE